ncbi:MAG TPA: GNAT family N-acetyltransferase, partial [Paracoccaceae bacterium]|nr:GNAT family N-acetyltransferase [Paracoccaceae bacterium]
RRDSRPAARCRPRPGGLGAPGAGGRPGAGWPAGPKGAFARLGAPGAPAGQVWSVVCFYLPPAHRGQGIARALLAAAAASGRAAGCTWIESYAVPPGERPYAFLGSTAFYAREGFAAVAPPGARRTVMRRALA